MILLCRVGEQTDSCVFTFHSMESAMALLEGMLVVLDDSPSDAANVPDIEQALSGPPTREESSFGMQERPLPTLASHRVHIDPESAPEVVEASYTSAKVCCGVTAGAQRIFTSYALFTSS